MATHEKKEYDMVPVPVLLTNHMVMIILRLLAMKRHAMKRHYGFD